MTKIESVDLVNNQNKEAIKELRKIENHVKMCCVVNKIHTTLI